MVLANVLIAGALLLLAYSGLRSFIELPFFALREVWVLGNVRNVAAPEIETVVKRELKGNFFTLDLKSAKHAFEKLSWVRTATLSRAWPNTLVVTLEEQLPFAKWGDDALVNVHGERFAGRVDSPLPEFAGPDGAEAEMTKQYRMFARVLEPLALAPSTVRLSERGAWAIRLNNGLSLELGREDIETRLARFVAVYPEFTAITGEAAQRLDLRYDNGFAVTRAKAAKGKG